jgi:hypothetical protein
MALTGVAQAATVLDVDFSMWQGKIGDPDGADDADRVQDLSGNGYHGFWGGGTGANNTPIIATPSGTGVDTTGTDGYVILRPGLSVSETWFTGTTPASYFVLDASKSYTFEAILQWGSSSDSVHGIMGQTGGSEWWIRENSGRLEYVFDDGPDRLEQTTTDPIDISSLETDGEWHHLAVVLDRGTDEVRTYVDYELIHTNSAAVIASLDTIGTTGDRRLGGYNTTASARFDGLQDRYRISDVVLAPNQFLGVPEPSALALSSLGLLSLGLVRWRRRRRA